MAEPTLEFLQITRITQELNADRRWVQLDPPRTVLVAVTPSGRTRHIPIDNNQLAAIVSQGAAILQTIIKESADA